MFVFIVNLQENAYEPMDIIDSVWSSKEKADERAAQIPKPKPPHFRGYIAEVLTMEVDREPVNAS